MALSEDAVNGVHFGHMAQQSAGGVGHATFPPPAGQVHRLRQRCGRSLQFVRQQVRLLRSPSDDQIHQTVVVFSMCTVPQ